jgi:hypothetical protein
MAKYIEFPLEGGGSILIETPDEPGKPQSGFVRAGVGEAVQEWSDKAQKTFAQSVVGVRQTAGDLLSTLTELSPDEIEVHFSLKATGELGGQLAIAKAGGEANYNVTLRWKKEAKKEEGESEK